MFFAIKQAVNFFLGDALSASYGSKKMDNTQLLWPDFNTLACMNYEICRYILYSIHLMCL